MNTVGVENGNIMNNTEYVVAIPKTWENRFKVFDKFNDHESAFFVHDLDSNNVKEKLTFYEKFRIRFNILAFLFGPIYYFFKGMWSKGFQLASIGLIFNAVVIFLTAVFQNAFFYRLLNLTGIIFPLFLMTIANYDYYKFVKFNERGYKFFGEPSVIKNLVLIIISVVVLSISISYFVKTVYYF